MTNSAPPATPRPLLGIGSCPAGNAVRYNGAATIASSRFTAATLTQLQHDFADYDDAFIHRQAYLDFYPREL